jgi:hypothetical protein
MANIASIVQDLKREREQIDQAIRALTSLSGRNSHTGARGRSAGAPKRRRLSTAARERIAAAQRARWAKVRAKKA